MLIRWLLQVQVSHPDSIISLPFCPSKELRNLASGPLADFCMSLAKLVDIKFRSVTGKDSGTTVISDQNLPLDRASLPFTWERSRQTLI